MGIVIRLIDGEFDSELSTSIAFRAVAAQAFRMAAEVASPTLLEPVMDVEVVMPNSFVGEVLGNLNARGADIQVLEARASGVQVIRVHVPLAQMFEYTTDLRSMTQGRGTFTMEFHHYAAVDSRQIDSILYGA